MLWFILALATAFLSATEAAIIKRDLTGLNAFETGLCPLVYALPMFLALWAMAPVPDPVPGPAFWWLILAVLPVNTLGFFLYISALSSSPLSLTMPYLSFTPVFVVLTGWLVLGEVPDAWGSAGIALVVAGSYVLNLDQMHAKSPRALLEPFTAIVREPGAWKMLAAAITFSLAAVLAKRAILMSSPMYFSGVFFSIFALSSAVWATALGLAKPRNYLAVHPKAATVVALMLVGHIVCHSLSISMAKAAYMLSVKRFSSVIGVVYGWAMFKETGLGFRLAGALLMFAGVVLIGIMAG